MWRLVYPLSYFRLRNREKTRADLLGTLILATILTSPFVAFPELPFFVKDGFVDKILVLTSALTGFYTAALVAAATLSHPDLDKTITSGPIALVTKDVDGNRVQAQLTRRQFACYIFGYLAFSSLLISLLGAFSIAVSARDWSGTLGEGSVIIRSALVFTFSILVSHMVCATGLGLYYLMDRLYRNDRVLRRTKEQYDRETGTF